MRFLASATSEKRYAALLGAAARAKVLLQASDAEASIHDGRYHDQQARMRAWLGVTCCYIYESETCRTSRSVATVLRRNALFRGIPCLYTTSAAGTAQLLSETLRDVVDCHASTPPPGLCIKSPLVKNSAVPPERAFEVMLSVLPKIGRKTAAAIAGVFATPHALSAALHAAEEGRRPDLVMKSVPKVSRPVSAYLAHVFGA